MKKCFPQSLQVFALALLTVSGVFALNLGGRAQGDVLRFYRIGDVLPLSPRLTVGNHSVYTGELGYDGQLFLTLALDPALREAGTQAALDNPRYRYRRILFPALGHVLAGGDADAVPYALVFLNILCFAGMAGISASIFTLYQKSPFWGLGVMAVPGYWCAFLLSTSDVLAGFLLVLAIWCGVQKRYWMLAVLYSLLILTHETMLLAGGGLMLCLLLQGKIREVFQMALGVIPAAAWNIYVLWRIPPGEGTSGITENFAWPGLGILHKVQRIVGGSFDVKDLYDGGTFLLLLLTFVFVLITSGPPKRSPFWCVTLAYFGFFLISKMQILSYYLDFLRVFGGAVLMGVLALSVTSQPRVHRGLIVLWAGASVALIFAYSGSWI